MGGGDDIGFLAVVSTINESLICLLSNLANIEKHTEVKIVR